MSGEEERVVVLASLREKPTLEAMAKLLYFDHCCKDTPIRLVVDVDTGSATAGMAVLGVMSEISAPVHTHCAGSAHYVAAAVVAAGAAGHRSAVANADFWIVGPPPCPAESKPEGLLALVKEWGAARKRRKQRDALLHDLLDALARATRQPAPNLLLDLSEGVRLSGPEAKSYGLVDVLVDEP